MRRSPGAGRASGSGRRSSSTSRSIDERRRVGAATTRRSCIARVAARDLGLPHVAAIRRERATIAQFDLDRRDRARNVAWRVPRRRRSPRPAGDPRSMGPARRRRPDDRVDARGRARPRSRPPASRPSRPSPSARRTMTPILGATDAPGPGGDACGPSSRARTSRSPSGSATTPSASSTGSSASWTTAPTRTVEFSNEHHRSASDAHIAEVTLVIDGQTLRSHAVGISYQAALDNVVDKVERQAVDHKSKPRSPRSPEGGEGPPAQDRRRHGRAGP